MGFYSLMLTLSQKHFIKLAQGHSTFHVNCKILFIIHIPTMLRVESKKQL